MGFTKPADDVTYRNRLKNMGKQSSKVYKEPTRPFYLFLYRSPNLLRRILLISDFCVDGCMVSLISANIMSRFSITGQFISSSYPAVTSERSPKFWQKGSIVQVFLSSGINGNLLVRWCVRPGWLLLLSYRLCDPPLWFSEIFIWYRFHYPLPIFSIYRSRGHLWNRSRVVRRKKKRDPPTSAPCCWTERKQRPLRARGNDPSWSLLRRPFQARKACASANFIRFYDQREK